MRFKFLSVGLPGLPALEYLEGENYLGIALSALMKIPKEEVFRLGAEALRKIQESPLSEQQKFLLSECVEAYLPLDEEQEMEFQALMQSEPYRGVKAVNLTSYDKGLLKGREALMDILQVYLERKFESEGMLFFRQLPTNMDIPALKALFSAAINEANLENLKKYLT